VTTVDVMVQVHQLDDVTLVIDSADFLEAVGPVTEELEQQVNETTVSIDNSRPTITSADGRFQLSLRARIQFDSAFSSASGVP